jgi:hypothetical protein
MPNLGEVNSWVKQVFGGLSLAQKEEIRRRARNGSTLSGDAEKVAVYNWLGDHAMRHINCRNADIVEKAINDGRIPLEG